MDLNRAAIEGGETSDITPLELQLAASPEDQVLRAKVLGHYFLRAKPGNPDRHKYTEQVLWFVENAPTSDISGAGFCSLEPEMDRPAFVKARATWLKHLKSHPKDLALIARAASFLTRSDRKLSEALYKRAIRLAPKNPHFHERIAHVYKLNAQGQKPTRHRAESRKALRAYETARRLSRRAESRFYQLDDLAELALDAGSLEKARRWAKEAIQRAADFRNDWNYGNALHRGHQVLGRIALRANRVPSAVAELLASGETPGSPQLNSFGPSFKLAHELLEKGAWDAVAEYLKRVGAFWEMGKGPLAKWSKDVAARQIPDFDQAFLYQSFELPGANQPP